MVYVVLPAFNEADAIVPLLDRLRKFALKNEVSLRVLIVDDGSSDDTAIRVRGFTGLPVELIQHPQNRGLAEAIRTGLTEALVRAHDDDVIVTMDADDTHAPALMGRMLARIDEGYNLVIASRYLPESRVIGLSKWREFLSWGAGVLFRITFPITGVKDYTCGYRAYHAGLLREAFSKWGQEFIDQPGFSCMVDILLKLSSLKPVVVEVPLLLRYDRKPGASKMQVGRTVAQTLKLMVKRRIGLPPGRSAA